jgi:non-ribosomal peptide synthetase component F
VRDRSRTPLFQVLFNYLTDAGASPTGSVQAKFDLAMVISESSGQLSGAIEYSTALFDRSTVDRLVGHFLELLDRLTVDVSVPLSSVSLSVAAVERGPVVSLPSVGGVHELFVDRGDLPAVVSGGVSVSYAELHVRANR